jgi:DNA-binding CsgD family transcriptional regulator
MIYNKSLRTRRIQRVKRAGKSTPNTIRNREIGQQLSLSVHTVKNYLFNIFEKLGISNRSELLMYVLANSDNTRLSVVDGGQSREDDVATTKHTPTREMQPNRGARTQRLLAS